MHAFDSVAAAIARSLSRFVSAAGGLAGLGVAVVGLGAEPVSFTFVVPAGEGSPLAREISAEVTTPAGRTVELPAYHVSGDRFAVRARAEVTGEYRLGRVWETRAGEPVALAAEPVGGAAKTAGARTSLSQIGTRRTKPGALVRADGTVYVPLGANLAWAPRDGVAWHREAFATLAGQGLNWARIWMSHWGGLNLDWLPDDLLPSPRPGQIDERIARNWDAVVAEAEARGIYLQVVLQHHGQWSSQVNPNWDFNPWNAAIEGGFLKKPGEFFTSAEARRLTRQKYRYIVARWGYSPAVLAWELFNEVHWVDALRLEHNEAAVAQWHDAMAAFIRSVDTYDHLVTTSTEDLHSPIYRSMDYLQPHLYATNMLAAVRRFDVDPAELDRPIFHGEMGDDHLRFTPEQKAAGVEMVPIAWASVMGQGRWPAQIWEGDQLLDRGRVAELGALARFLEATRLPLRDGLVPCEAVVTSVSRVPLRVMASENWQKRPAQEFRVATDGRQPLAYGTVPRILVGRRASLAEGYPGRVTFRVDYPTAATARLEVATASAAGAGVRVQVDGKTVAEHRWPGVRAGAAGQSVARPAVLSWAVEPGERTIVVENTGGGDWVDLEGLDTGLETAALAAVGRRGDDFIALWVWHREGIFALDPAEPVTGMVTIEGVAAGDWEVAWWDAFAGKPAGTHRRTHPGGALTVATPSIARHAAVVLTRARAD